MKFTPFNNAEATGCDRRGTSRYTFSLDSSRLGEDFREQVTPRIMRYGDNPEFSSFTILMGDRVEPRKDFIVKHALEARNIDIQYVLGFSVCRKDGIPCRKLERKLMHSLSLCISASINGST